LAARSWTGRSWGVMGRGARSGGAGGGFWRRVAVRDGKTLGYEVSGNVLACAVGGVAWRYVYDPENRLREVWRGGERVAFVWYDGEGNRVVREVGGMRAVGVDEGDELCNGGCGRSTGWATRRWGCGVWGGGGPFGRCDGAGAGGQPGGGDAGSAVWGIRVERGGFPPDWRFTGQRWEASLGS
jgi:hypothetical protein